MKPMILVAAITCAGCQMAGRLQQDPDYRKREPLRASLMKDEHAILSEEAIHKLLASRIELPEKAKLAVFRLASPGVMSEETWSWSVTVPIGFLQAQKEQLSALEEPLAKTGRFVEITHVPRLLVGEPSLTRLREAAALMQSDLLLVYATASELVTDPGNLFTKDYVKAYGSIELLLMDVRTGVIPYAETFDGVHEVKESRQDWNLVDLQHRAQHEGTLAVLRTAGGALASFCAKR